MNLIRRLYNHPVLQLVCFPLLQLMRREFSHLRHSGSVLLLLAVSSYRITFKRLGFKCSDSATDGYPYCRSSMFVLSLDIIIVAQ